MPCESIAGVVLAGGKGLRMGGDKSLVDLAGRTLLQRTADRLSGLFSEVIVVCDAPERFRDLPYRREADHFAGCGPLGGLATALRIARTETVFVAACDMPFLKPEVIRSMITLMCGHDLLIPTLAHRFHPLHALYTKKCLPAIESQIEAGDLTLHRLTERVNSFVYPEELFRLHDPACLSVMNINTPEDLEQARKLMERE